MNNLKIPQYTWQTLMAAVRYNRNMECSGFAEVFTNDDGDLELGGIIIPPQVISAVHVHFDASDVDWMAEYAIQNKLDIGSYWCWWHSHNTMPADPSGTDHSTGTLLAQDVWSKAGRALSLVVNAKGDAKALLTFRNPVLRDEYNEVFLPVKVDEVVYNDVVQTVNARMKEAVREPPPPKPMQAKGSSSLYMEGSVTMYGLEKEVERISNKAMTLGINSLSDSEWAILAHVGRSRRTGLRELKDEARYWGDEDEIDDAKAMAYVGWDDEEDD